MKTDLECAPCIIRQALNTLGICSIDEKKKHKVVREVLRQLGVNYLDVVFIKSRFYQ